MAFPPTAYTGREGVPMVAVARRTKWMLGDEPLADQEGAQSEGEERAVDPDCDKTTDEAPIAA